MIIVFLLAASLLEAQTFDVASIRLVNARDAKSVAMNKAMNRNANGIQYTSVTLRDCLAAAYQVKGFQISGPAWLDSEAYDINAKTDAAFTDDQLRSMLQALLAERFKLTFHRDKKELPVFALVVGRDGPKVKAAQAEGAESAGPKFQIKTGSLFFPRTSMAGFADYLSRLPAIGRPVVDMTSLPGVYDINLRLVDNPGEAKPEDMKRSLVDWREGSAIFAQIQQLGLKLEPQKAPTDVLVIDHVEKTPTEN